MLLDRVVWSRVFSFMILNVLVIIIQGEMVFLIMMDEVVGVQCFWW